jgi:hypothetical protein
VAHVLGGQVIQLLGLGEDAEHFGDLHAWESIFILSEDFSVGEALRVREKDETRS